MKFTSSQESFYSQLAGELQATKSLGPTAPRIGTTGVLSKFMEIIKKLGLGIDLSSMTKEEFLAVVGKAFDTIIAPMLASSGPFIVMAVRALAMMLAARFYDARVKLPKLA